MQFIESSKVVTGNTRRKASSKKSSTKLLRFQISSMSFFWMLGGIIFGVFISCLIFDRISSSNLALAKSSFFKGKVAKEDNKFEFYSMLGQQAPTKKGALQDKINQHKKQQNKSSIKEQDLKTTSLPLHYSVQVSSFREKKEAEELKAKLILNGFKEPMVDNITTSSGKNWYRVLLGPLNSEKEAIQHQQALAAIDISGSLILQQKGD